MLWCISIIIYNPIYILALKKHWRFEDVWSKFIVFGVLFPFPLFCCCHFHFYIYNSRAEYVKCTMITVSIWLLGLLLLCILEHLLWARWGLFSLAHNVRNHRGQRSFWCVYDVWKTVLKGIAERNVNWNQTHTKQGFNK